MFSKPRAGWTTINIGEYHGNGSYLTDIPFDFLEAAAYSLENNVPFTLFIDEEGIESYITSYHMDTFINRIAKDIETYHSDIGFLDLIKEGVEDIEKHIPDWASFCCSVDEEDEVEGRISLLKYLIDALKSYL